MHPLEKFNYCPICGSKHFVVSSPRSKRCENCGFEYFLNPSAANANFILNEQDELLVITRKREPGKGTLDLPGGFADLDETAEEGARREVMEETGLTVDKMTYLFSFPNVYRYSGFDVRTLDSFFLCEVSDTSLVHPADDAERYQWIPLKDIHTELFGMRSIRRGILKFLEMKGIKE